MSRALIDEGIQNRIDEMQGAIGHYEEEIERLEAKIKSLTLREEALKVIQHQRLEMILHMIRRIVTTVEDFKPID